MSLRSSVRFFYRGPGVALVLVGAIIGIGYVVKQGNDKRDAEKAKREKTRELGRVSPHDSVDASTASKETVLANGRLIPGFQSQPETGAAPIPNSPVRQRQAALPTLVSFYAQVQSTPSPTPAPEPERPKPQMIWLPRGTFIPCALVNTVESSHINTPVVGEVLRDVTQGGHLIIPAGAIVTCFAQAGAVRDRIEVSGKWSITYPDGKEVELTGIACDREADPANQQFGIEDGSAGLQGELVESDHWANAKAFLALLMTSTTQIATSAANGVVSRGISGGVALPDTSAIQAKYLDQLLNGETGDGRFVRVSSSKEFYLFPVDIIEPSRRSPGARIQEAEEQAKLDRESQRQSAIPESPSEIERQLLRNAQPDAPPTPEPRIHYGQ